MYTKITDADLHDKGVIGLPDSPNLSTHDMQAKFDEIALAVIVPAVNRLIDELEAATSAGSLGAMDGEDETTIQAIIDDLKTAVSNLQTDSHTHTNKTQLDYITQTLLDNIDAVILMLTGITSVAGSVSDTPNAIPTCRAIVNYVSMLGGGDMMKSVYDQDNDGVVDDSEKLGGELPSYYQTATDNTLTTTDKTVAGAINEVVSTIGDLDDLTTSDKDSVVDAINDARENAIECVGGSTIETIGESAVGSYAVGELFVADDGYVYKATAIIAPGNTLSGSNCSKTNLKTELNAINTTLVNKVSKFTGGGYVPVDSLAYDSTNKNLGLKVNGSNTTVPFLGYEKKIVTLEMAYSSTAQYASYPTGFNVGNCVILSTVYTTATRIFASDASPDHSTKPSAYCTDSSILINAHSDGGFSKVKVTLFKYK